MPIIAILGWAEVSHSVLVMLAKWFSLPRLETRTKESNACVSFWVVKLCCALKEIVGMFAPATNQAIV